VEYFSEGSALQNILSRASSITDQPEWDATDDPSTQRISEAEFEQLWEIGQEQRD
jgi:hypothetical protein